MSPIDLIFNGDATPYQPTLAQADIGFQISTPVVAGASTVAGTLKITGPAAAFSISGSYSSTGNWASPDGTFQTNLDANNLGSVSIASIATGKVYQVRFKLYTQTGQNGTSSPFLQTTFSVPTITNAVIGQIKTNTGSNDFNEVTALSVPINNEIQVSKSFLQISTDIDNPRTYSLAVKNSGLDMTGSYYSFGTTLFFLPSDTATKQSAGMGFFVSGSNTGYFVVLKTALNSGIAGDEFSIMRVDGGKMKLIKDSEVLNTERSVKNTQAGKSYKIDIKVKVEAFKVTIDAYINGFKVTATDIGNAKTPVLPKTANLALYTNIGTTYFDYIYGIKLEESEYNRYGIENIYSTQLSSTVMNLAYGEFFIDGTPKLDSATPIRYVEEFGPVAREIRYVKVRYAVPPKIPKWTYNNLNSDVGILGAKLTPFEAEMYIINNSGTSNPLDSSLGTKISVVGNDVIKSDQIVYMDDTINKYDVQEPIVFESSWIQNSGDAKALSDFIKTQWSKNQKTVELEVFGNPGISVHDIIAINYPLNGLDGTQKFIVTDVSHSWNNGLETNITARSIVS